MTNKLDRIWGYLNNKKTKAPFYFDPCTFELIVFPSENMCGFEDLNLLGKCASQFANVKDQKWIGRCALHGVTAKGHFIIFNASEDCGVHHSTKIYQVQWLFEYPRECDIQKIDGFYVTGEVVNAFYSPIRALEHDIKFNGKGGFESISVESRNPAESDAGSFCLRYDEEGAHNSLNVDIKLIAYASITIPSESPFKSTSNMDFEYENPASLSAIIENYRYVCNFFMYTCYRSDINFDDILAYWTDNDGRKNYCGRLVWKLGTQTIDKLSEDEKKKQKACIIKYELLKEHTADIFAKVGNESFSYDHLVPFTQRRHYSVGRFITILTAFEREYRNIYGPDSLRSEKYKNFKKKIEEEFHRQCKNYHGDERKWFKDFVRGISKRDDSYKSRFKKALDDNMDVMGIFLNYSYHDEEGTTEAVSMRVGQMRNDFAHNNLDMEIEPINLADIEIVEKLLYCIRLKDIGLSTNAIQMAIAELFGENWAIIKLKKHEDIEVKHK